jgi:curved DNA-binding protein CbpA
MDEVQRAYAVLGLKAGTSFGEVRRRYRALARRWHPDRHADEARNLNEATETMRRLNDAYRTLERRLGRGPQRAADRPAPPAPGRPLSREELDAMVESIGPDGPVDWMLDSVGWVGGTLRGVLAVIGFIILAVRLVRMIAAGDFAAIVRDPALATVLLMLVAALVILVADEIRKRREVADMRGGQVSDSEALR